MKAPGVMTEPTPQGEQMLVCGVEPITARDRLSLRWEAPLAPRVPQKPLNIGLFDEDARNQLSMF